MQSQVENELTLFLSLLVGSPIFISFFVYLANNTLCTIHCLLFLAMFSPEFYFYFLLI